MWCYKSCYVLVYYGYGKYKMFKTPTSLRTWGLSLGSDPECVQKWACIVTAKWYIYIYICPNPQRTSKWRPFMRTSHLSKGPERTWKDLKGPERTWKDLKGPERTWKDLKGPERTWKDLKGPERTSHVNYMLSAGCWGRFCLTLKGQCTQDRIVSFKMIARNENTIEGLWQTE